jgi:WD40 repeat protein
MSGHGDGISALAILADGEHALSGDDTGAMRLWSLSSGDELRCHHTRPAGINGLAAFAGVPWIVSAEDDRTIRLWLLESGNVLSTFHAEGAVLSCAVRANPLGVVAGDGTGRVHVLRIFGPRAAGSPP